MTKLSVVVAVFNEEDNIRPLIKSITEVFEGSDLDYEIIIVDDGSTDNTVGEVKNFLTNKLVLVELKGNFGQTAALKAGIDISEGDYIGTLDGDLQNDPLDLLLMHNLIIEKDCDFITGIRANRFDGFFLRKLPSRIANRIIGIISGTGIKDNGCGTKLFRADVLRELPLYGERHRFLPTLAALEGASFEQLNVNHHPRIHGKSKYGLGRTFKVISDLMLLNFTRKYRQKPMYLFGTIGFIASFLGIAILVYMLIEKLGGHDIWGRPLLLLGILLLLFGFQIISTGLLIDAVIRNSYETDRLKPYKIKRVVKADQKA